MDHDSDKALIERNQEARRRIRTSEFEAVAGYFAPEQRVLDYGAGSGFMSTLMARLGCEVEAVDVDTRPWMYRPVRLYDGVRLPYPDRYFDVVFTCFALEHLPELPRCLREMARVLKNDGRMIHIVPTASWRAWSNLTHVLWLTRLIRRRLGTLRSRTTGSARTKSDSARVERQTARRRLRTLLQTLVPPPHGDLAANSMTEIAQYRLSRWRRRFSEGSLEIVAEHPTGVFDAEHLLLANISERGRRRLARFLGSSGYVFVMRRRSDTGARQTSPPNPA